MTAWWHTPLADGQSCTADAVQVTQGQQPNPVVTRHLELAWPAFLVIDIALLLSPAQLADFCQDRNSWSKLYFARVGEDFSETRTLWFRLQQTTARQTVLLGLSPDSLAAAEAAEHGSPSGNSMRFMLDALPHIPHSCWRVHAVRVGQLADLQHWLREIDPLITPQAVRLAGAWQLQPLARDLVSLLARKLRTGSFAVDYPLTNAIIAALRNIGDPAALALMANRLDVHHYHYHHGALQDAGGIRGVQNGEDHRLVLGIFPAADYVVLDVLLDIDWANTRFYDYSKLYFSVLPARPDADSAAPAVADLPFCESRVACFRVQRSGVQQTLAVRLPLDGLQAGDRLALRLDPLPGCHTGRFAITGCRTVDAAACDSALRRQADLDFTKQQTRRAVADSEARQQSPISHLPESITLELTPRCDFTCGHCSSHGTQALHDEYNRMPVFPLPQLDRLAADVFPALSTLTIVGRGEPSIVPDRYWQRLMGHLRDNRTLFTMVTHGYHLPRRITADNIDLVDTITISIDGITQDTYARNRGGKDLARVLAHAAGYHALRQQSHLARRPRLCFSWTLLQNNIHEFPDFVRYVARFEPDLLYVRHLLVYHSKDMQQSLFAEPERANHFLREAYAVMAEHGIRGDCPPLFNAVEIAQSKHRIAASHRSSGFRPLSGEPLSGEQQGEPVPVILGSFRQAGAAYVRLTLAITVDLRDAARYQHSKLYFDRSNRRQFSEQQVLCFTVPRQNEQHHTTLRLPFVLQAGEAISFRLDPLAGCRYGQFTISHVELCTASCLTSAEQQQADRRHHIATLRQRCKAGEAGFSLDMLQATIQLPVSKLAMQCQLPRLPDVATVILVEPPAGSAVADNAPGQYWPALLTAMRQYSTLFRLQTGGEAIPAYVSADSLDLLDGVEILADTWPAFAASAADGTAPVPATVQDYHRWRLSCGLARRPRLYCRWSLTADNASQLARFVDAVLPLMPDGVTITTADADLPEAALHARATVQARLVAAGIPCEIPASPNATQVVAA